MELTPDRIAAHNQVQLDHYAVDASQNPRLRPTDSPYVHRHVERMVDFAGLRPGERILDVGCGMGKFTLPMLRRGLDVEGLDLSPDLLEVLRGELRGDEHLELHCADLLDPPDGLLGRYDVLVGFFVLHHLVDLPASFRAMRRLLRPGGRAAFIEPNGLNPLYPVQITLTPGMSWRSDRGVLRMTQRRLTRALCDSGFQSVRAERQGALPPALYNRPWGPALERTIERGRALPPVPAFQLIGASVPAPPARGTSTSTPDGAPGAATDE